MQKKLIALAIAGLASTAAFAQSNVTVYGRVDYGYVSQSGNSGGVQNVNSKQMFASGVAAGSRLGFKGSEDLGNGLKAIFETEFGTGIDQTAAGTTAATWVNRHSYVGLTGGFGTAIGGRVDGVRYGIFNKYDAFAGGTVGNFTQMTPQVDRADNAIAYISPVFAGGFTVTAAYATNIAGPEAAGNVGDSRLNTLAVGYANGPISVDLDYETVKTVEATAITGDTKTTVTTLAGSYDFGVVKLSGLWDTFKTRNNLTGTDTVDFRNYFISLKAPFAGKFVAKATYGQVNDKLVANNDASKWGIGIDYQLSKRTTIYADYGSIKNDNTAAYQVSAAANANGNNGVKGFDIGVGHNF